MRLIHLWALLIALDGNAQEVPPPPVDVRAQLPDRLKTLLDAPRSKTSEIEWTVTWFGDEVDGMVERFVTRTAGDVIWQSNPGDDRGLHYDWQYDQEKRRIITDDAVPGTRQSLIYEGRAWYLPVAERPLSGEIASVDDWVWNLPLDVTVAGVCPAWGGATADQTGLGLGQAYLWGFESATFSAFRSGGIETIVGEFVVRRTAEGDIKPNPSDVRRVEWDLDLHHGGQPVRAAYYWGDRLLFWSETELAEVNGRWMPHRIRFHADGAPEPSHVLEVQKATFDQPWHTQEIRPEDIGILFGTQLLGKRPTGGDGFFRWDGTRLLSGEEYFDSVWVYGVDPDPRITELLAESFYRNAHLSREERLSAWQERVQRLREAARDEYYKEQGQAPWLVQRWKERDEWDVYVGEFIKKHEIDGARADRAQYLLRRAKQLRDYQKGKTDDRITKARRENEYAKVAHFQEAGEKRTKEIFDQLVRGLEALVPKEDRKLRRTPTRTIRIRMSRRGRRAATNAHELAMRHDEADVPRGAHVGRP